MWFWVRQAAAIYEEAPIREKGPGRTARRQCVG